MKYFFIVVGLLLATSTQAQIQDDFSDGDFTVAPQWLGSTGNYVVNSSLQLQLNQTVAGTSYLYTPLVNQDFDDKEWNLWVRQTFAGSGTNYGRVYLIANSNDLSTNPDGIYLQLGEANATDAIRLVQRFGGVNTVLCSTADGTIANSFSARVKVRRTQTGVWELYADLAGGQDVNFVAQANEVSVPVGSNFGYLNVYTATNSNRFYLDDIYYGDFIQDVTAPTIANTTVVNTQRVRIEFSEPVTADALDAINWSFTPALTISAINWVVGGNTAVEIDFVEVLTNGQNYAYEVNNITDLAANVAPVLSGTFSYLVAEVPVVGDVIINEFFPDPSPQVGLPEQEFVEIYNRSNKIFNLQGWKIADNATQGTINGSHWLMPGGYAILTANNNVPLFPGSIGVTSWPSLNNSTDDVAIISQNGLELERLTFTLDWYHDASKQDGGWTLERINPETDCSDFNNWKASEHPDGGTPGVVNSVYDLTPDTVAPEIQSVQFSNSQLTITFTENVDVNSLDLNGISFTPSVTIVNTQFAGAYNHQLVMELSGVTPNQSYNFVLGTAADCAGNTSSPLAGAFTYMIAEEPVEGDVIINEFMADPSPVVGLPEVEFVELYNRSTKVFNLQGWKLGDNSTFGTIGAYWLQPGQYVILTANNNVSQFSGNVVGVTSFPSLGNAADEVKIKSASDVIIDELAYTSAWYRDETKIDGGWTIERINPELTCSSVLNWRASVNVNGGTPGEVNSVFDLTPDTTPAGIEQYFVQNDTLNIYMNEAVQTDLITNSSFAIQPNANIESILSNGTLSNHIQIVFSDILPNTNYSLTLSGVTDCAGNSTNLVFDFGVPSVAQVGDVIINEVLFDPLTGGSDYIELYNKSDKWIDLKGWKVGKYASGAIGQMREINIHYLLQPNDFVVLSPDTTFILQNFPFAAAGSFIQMSLPALNSDSSTFYVFANVGGADLMMDQLSYSKKWHFRLLENTKGKSLERLSYDSPTQDANNWHTAAESQGWGTPGYKNSQYSPAAFNGAIHFTSDVMSPDNDGFEDVLQINYMMEKPGMIGTIRIYDDVGREVKLLTNNEYLGAQGTLIWDGVRDDGLKAKIGVYVLVLEAYNDQGDSYNAKKAFTVAGKL